MNSSSRFILTAMSAAILAGQPQPAKLTGRWRSVEVSPTGISTIFEFHNDNQLDSYAAAISDVKFRIVGTDTILLRSNSGEEKQELEWNGQDHALIENEALGKSIKLTRIGTIEDPKNPVIGAWSTALDWKGQTYPGRAFFRTDGTVLWVVMLRTEHGSYSLLGNKIRLQVTGRPVIEGDFSLSEERLILPKPNGRESSFQRF